MFKLNLLLLSAAVVALAQLPALAQNPVYNLSYARSLAPTATAASPKVETVVSIRNTNKFNCRVSVDWLNTAGAIIGTSGPAAVPVNNTLEFTTANLAEVVHPFILDVFRNTFTNFEGSANILTDCPVDTLFGVNASTVSYYPTFTNNVTAPSFMTISVTRPEPDLPTGGRLGD